MPPVTVDRGMFMHCVTRMSTVTERKPLTALKTMQKLQAWCNTALLGERPDWDVRRCTGMAELLAHTLREDLETQKTLAAEEVCKKIFLAIGSLHRVEFILKDAFTVTTRGVPPIGPQMPPADDPGLQRLVKRAG